MQRSWTKHYIDVIMITMASQITSLTVVYSAVYSDADQRKRQSSASLAFVWGIHRDRWIPRTKGQLRGKCFHLMTSSWYTVYWIFWERIRVRQWKWDDICYGNWDNTDRIGPHCQYWINCSVKNTLFTTFSHFTLLLHKMYLIVYIFHKRFTRYILWWFRTSQIDQYISIWHRDNQTITSVCVCVCSNPEGYGKIIN